MVVLVMENHHLERLRILTRRRNIMKKACLGLIILRTLWFITATAALHKTIL